MLKLSQLMEISVPRRSRALFLFRNGVIYDFYLCCTCKCKSVHERFLQIIIIMCFRGTGQVIRLLFLFKRNAIFFISPRSNEAIKMFKKVITRQSVMARRFGERSELSTEPRSKQ